LIRIDSLGDVVALTVADGLASDATHHVTATADGQLWVATDAGISRYVPETSR
jgi:ligand-binding sensor domain-containing protein